ncbi:TetR/AcrR family transcriptional regulator [Xinfangfangia pollutisoli]|uniref:TetR/AcrR family transcriptional regulator n=1 Tax=Xinfangfangia pollutisoli TaxID=2865960 RepID=UPI001CD3E1E6|nr:TetR-like C-terminal domain-containing protein [Xinfangfangia pollutisoli]
MTEKPYHHGNLRAALLGAAEAELAEAGVEGFSLRSVARRAGVSHAAPKHHFGDTTGLLTALAAEGFQAFVAAQTAREEAAGAHPSERLLASGLGYVDFACARPALFRLIFTSRRIDESSDTLVEAGSAAYLHLAGGVAAAGGREGDIAAFWAMAHGLADLMMSGRLAQFADLPPDERDAALVAILRRALP